MRDEKDPGTIDMSFPKRRGRPPVGKVAMSDAERAAKYRAVRREAAASRSVARRAEQQTDAVLLDALRIAVFEGRAPAIWLLTQELRDRYPSRE